jgi:hypothetical protein
MNEIYALMQPQQAIHPSQVDVIKSTFVPTTKGKGRQLVGAGMSSYILLSP